MSALSLTSWTREMEESPISEQQSGSLVRALKQRPQSSKSLLAQKAVSVSLAHKLHSPIIVLFHFVTE